MKILLSAVVLLLTAIAFSPTAFAADAPAPSIQGSYVLDYRELPDGTKVRSPEISGMITFTKDHRNFNVYWTEKGKPVSISLISKYTLSATEYTEQSLFYFENGIQGKGPTYTTTPTSGKAPVKINGDRIEIQLPLFGEPNAVFDKAGLTATRTGVFVDHWKKID